MIATLKKIVSISLKIILFAVIISVLLPVVYFAWRAGQPMSMLEYDGRTYYELLSERRHAYTDHAAAYQSTHPGVNVKDGICFFTEVGIELLEMPISGHYAMAAIYPNMLRSIDPRDVRNGYIPAKVTWSNLLPASWNVFEMFVWGTVSHAPEGPVPYCRISAP